MMKTIICSWSTLGPGVEKRHVFEAGRFLQGSGEYRFSDGRTLKLVVRKKKDALIDQMNPERKDLYPQLLG